MVKDIISMNDKEFNKQLPAIISQVNTQSIINRNNGLYFLKDNFIIDDRTIDKLFLKEGMITINDIYLFLEDKIPNELNRKFLKAKFG